jgi:hypothetical protein
MLDAPDWIGLPNRRLRRGERMVKALHLDFSDRVFESQLFEEANQLLKRLDEKHK